MFQKGSYRVVEKIRMRPYYIKNQFPCNGTSPPPLYKQTQISNYTITKS